MNHQSSFSSSPTPPPAIHPLLQACPNSTAGSQNCQRTRLPSIIPIDYNYQTMSPSSQSELRQQDVQNSIYFSHLRRPYCDTDVTLDLCTQYSSLFGDPVPPVSDASRLDYESPPAFVRALSSSLENSNSSEEETYERTIAMLNTGKRLFSNVPYSSSLVRRVSMISNVQNEKTKMEHLSTVPQLQPPDIQILPNSSGGSSSEPLGSPNYALLTPDDMRGTQQQEEEFLEQNRSDSIIEIPEFTEPNRRVSNISEDFKNNVGDLK